MVPMGRIWAFSIAMRRRSYNTYCECVIDQLLCAW